MRTLDANIFLRYLTGDDSVKATACFDVFQSLLRGEEEAITFEVIVAEVVFVLSSPRLYRLDHDEIVARLAPLVRAPGLRLDHKETVLRALDLYAAHAALDFEDVMLVAHMERLEIDELVSYDRGFDRLPGVRRTEP